MAGMDWVRFFNDHNITYVEKGRNVKKGHVNIRCPFCGPDDPSEHMGVSLNGDVYGCWRSANHAGYKPWNLIRPLLGCSFQHARLVAQQYSVADPETVDEALAALVGHDNADKPRAKPAPARTLKFPNDFRRIERDGVTRRFWHYLEERKFDSVRQLVSEYNLKCTTTGIWKDRIIFPIYVDGELVSWTGRAIMQTIDAPRYKVLGMEEDPVWSPSAVLDRNEVVYNANQCTGGSLLLCCEGPIDALKMEFYGMDDGASALCPLGTRMSQEQACIIGERARKYKRKLLLYDLQEVETVFLAMDLLGRYGFEVGQYPSWVTDDVGALSPKRSKELVRSFLP